MAPCAIASAVWRSPSASSSCIASRANALWQYASMSSGRLCGPKVSRNTCSANQPSAGTSSSVAGRSVRSEAVMRVSCTIAPRQAYVQYIVRLERYATRPRGRSLLRLRLRVGLALPQHVDDHPPPVDLADLQIVDPVRRDDLDHRRVLVAIEDGDLLELLVLRRLLAVPGAHASDQLRRAHVLDPARAVVGHDDALDQLGVQRAGHPLDVALVPALDVVEGGLANRSRLRIFGARRLGGGGREKRREEGEREDGAHDHHLTLTAIASNATIVRRMRQWQTLVSTT